MTMDSPRMIVDLNDASTSINALQALGRMDWRKKVSSASIVQDRRDPCSKRSMMALCELEKLPKLKTLTLDLGMQPLSLPFITLLLKAAKGLNALTINSVFYMAPATAKEWEEVKQALAGSNIRQLSLQGCHEEDAFAVWGRSFHSHSRNAPQLGSFLLACMKALDLRELSVGEILVNSQAYDFANAIIDSKLKRLHVSSSLMGQEAGDFIVHALITTPTISDVTLLLGDGWETQGFSIADLLSSNTNLAKLHLRMINSDMDAMDVAIDIVRVIKSMKSTRNTTLSSLCIETDLSLLRHYETYKIIFRFVESMLRTNHTVQELRIISDFGKQEELQLSESVSMRLALNRSGLSKLLHEEDKPVNSYISAMARADGDIDVLYTALQSCPELFSGV